MNKYHISYWGLTINASVRELWDILGSPDEENNEGEPTHCNYCWHGIYENGEDVLLFDVYDYLSKDKFLKDEQVQWRINASGAFNSLRVKDYLIEKLNSLRMANV